MKVLVDTSIWIDHINAANSELIDLLERRLVLIHSTVIGELACGNFKNRQQRMGDFKLLARASEATDDEVLEMIEFRKLYGKGLSWVDAQLLASAALSAAALWTADKNLRKLAAEIAY